MKTKLIFFCLITSYLLYSCTKSNDSNVEFMSECIAEKIESFKTEPRLKDYSYVTEYEYNGKLYYDFDYGAAADWPKYLLDTKCDTVCKSGFKSANFYECNIPDFYQKAVLKQILVK